MSISGYGIALYYPYIHLQDENWMKVAALYYDELRRIVPEGYRTQDSDIVRLLNDRFQFIKDLHPGRESKEIAGDFLRFAIEQLSDTNKRKDLFIKIGKLLPPKSAFRIHVGKISRLLRMELPKIGLAKKSSAKGPWYDFEPVTGALYMTCLANKMAENRELPIVTDDPVYQPLIRSFQHDRYTWRQRKDTGHSLASLVIRTAIPKNIESVSIQKIVEFRQKHDDERHRFYEAICSLAEDIPEINEPDAFRDCLDYHKRTIDEAIKDLKLSLADVGIGCVTGLLGLSLPSWASNLAKMEPGLAVQIASGALVCLAAGVLISEGRNIYKSKRRSPWSYVLSLKRDLDSDGFIRSLFGSAKIL